MGLVVVVGIGPASWYIADEFEVPIEHRCWIDQHQLFYAGKASTLDRLRIQEHQFHVTAGCID